MTTLSLAGMISEREQVACGNCNWTGPAGVLEDICDAQDRLEPGCPIPAGECPACGALAYPVDEEEEALSFPQDPKIYALYGPGDDLMVVKDGAPTKWWVRSGRGDVLHLVFKTKVGPLDDRREYYIHSSTSLSRLMSVAKEKILSGFEPC